MHGFGNAMFGTSLHVMRSWFMIEDVANINDECEVVWPVIEDVTNIDGRCKVVWSIDSQVRCHY